MVKFCTKCGTQTIDNQSSFCNKCGTQFPVNMPENKWDNCPKCGLKAIDNKSKFCAKCGTNLSNLQLEKPINQNQNSRPVGYNIPLSRQNLYKSNFILTLALIVGLISIFISPIIVIIVVIVSAIAVYQDAKEIGIGNDSNEETFSTKSWSPLSWGLMVLLLWIIGLPLYLIKRRELFYQNAR